MVILLQGGSRIGRVTIAEKLIKNRKQWRHLPAEDVQAAVFFGALEWEDSADMIFSLACACAHEMKKEKYNLVISCADAPEIIAIFQNEFPKKSLAVHLQKSYDVNEALGFDLAFNTKDSSAGDVSTEIGKMIR